MIEHDEKRGKFGKEAMRESPEFPEACGIDSKRIRLSCESPEAGEDGRDRIGTL